MIVTGKQKCDDLTLKALQAFGDVAKAGQSGHCLIYQLPKQDKKAQNTKLYQCFNTHGMVVDCHIYSEQDRRELLVYQAGKFGLSLALPAWQFLLDETEHHLLSAYQALWRAADLYNSTPKTPMTLDVEKLMPVLVSDYQYSVFHLCDTLLLGDAKKSQHILHHLRQVDTAPSVILWGIAKEIRQVLALQSGKSMQALGIWQSKTKLYHQALNRYTIQPKHLMLVYDIDKSIKGVGEQNVWQALEMLCLSLCGVGVLAH